MSKRRESPLNMVMVLGLMCAAAGLALGATYRATRAKIRDQQRSERMAALRILLPKASRDGFRQASAPKWAVTAGGNYYGAYDVSGELVGYAREVRVPKSAFATDGKYYEAYSAPGELVGYALEAAGKGYSSTVHVTVGVDPKGEVIRGIRITSQQETPGLGANCAAIETKGTLWDAILGRLKHAAPSEPWFQSQFRGKTSDSFVKVGNKYQNIDGLTGATITTNAVTDAVVAAVKEFKEKVLEE